MKVEPIEYLVTFEDGQEFMIERLGVTTWIIVHWDDQYIVEHGFIGQLKTFEEALEALKKWKEKNELNE